MIVESPDGMNAKTNITVDSEFVLMERTSNDSRQRVSTLSITRPAALVDLKSCAEICG